MKAKILADSISSAGQRLTTFQIEVWKPLLAEINTHKRLSRNFGSSRAKPIAKVLEQVVNQPFQPVEFRQNQKGMGSNTPLDSARQQAARELWLLARDSAVISAQNLLDLEVAKEQVNRLLEPFMFVDGIITATEGSLNAFFRLRLHPAAQAEMRELAMAMYNVLQDSKPILVTDGDWHLPFVTFGELNNNSVKVCRMLSAARCARVSYIPLDGMQNDHTRDIKRANDLLASKHLSCFEHQATPTGDDNMVANLRGWRNLRTVLEGEMSEAKLSEEELREFKIR